MSRIQDTITPNVLEEFQRASKALWRDLPSGCGGGDFSKNDIYFYAQKMMERAMTEAEIEGLTKAVEAFNKELNR